MTKLEIACVVIGFIGMCMSVMRSFKIMNWKDALSVGFFTLLRDAAFLSMILLPLYFRLWKR